MKKRTWLAASAAMILAVTVALAQVSFAQPQGQGMGRRGQGGQAWCQGYGPGNANCPNYPGYRNRWQGGDTSPQARRGRRWNQQMNPPAPQSAVPEATTQ